MFQQEPRDLDLTERQEAILRALVRRTPIKQIAFDNAIAPSTVNDHIRAMKRKLEVSTTAELVAHFLEADTGPAAPPDGGETKCRMSRWSPASESSRRGHAEALSLSDSMAFSIRAPWAGRGEPRVVPEELDGPAATIPRLLAIAKAVALILAAVVLAIVALDTVDGLVASGAASDR